MKWVNARKGMLAVTGLVLLAAAFPLAAHPASVGYEYRRVARTRAHVVTVDLNDPAVAVTLVLARDGIGNSESFSSMIHRSHPDAAITGTFFGIKGLQPIGNLVRDGQLLYPVATGTTLAITRDNQAVVLATNADQQLDWNLYSAALFTGPTLLRDGRCAVKPWAERFRARAHYRPARRTAIGIKPNNKLVLVTVARPVTLTRMAAVMKAVGARDAFGLDGGTSAALYYRGRTIVHPGRKLTHILAVYANGSPPVVAGAPREDKG